MLTTYLTAASFALSLVAVASSTISVLIHYARRAENPVLAPVEAAIQSLQLSQADLVDRVDHWTRRDRTRRLREGKADDEPQIAAPVLSPMEVKRELRMRAKQMGVIR